MRFNTPAEVKQWARTAAASDYKKHQVIHVDENGQTWQVDKNPYCTPGARNDWRRGFLNASPRAHETPTVNDYCTKYQRGRAMAELITQQEPTA